MFIASFKENKIPFFFFSFILLVAILIIGNQPQFELQTATNKLANDQLDQIFLFITKLAEGWLTVPLLIFLFVKDWKKAVYIGVCYGVTALIAMLIKNYGFIENQRPWGLSEYRYLEGYHWIKNYEMPTGGSFPSGHTTTAFCVAMGLSFIIKNKYLSIPILILACLVGFSRTLLSFHFLTDVTAGATIGGVTSFLFYVILRKPLKL